jgi:hypothetical protein
VTIQGGGSATVNGSLFIGSEYQDVKNTESRLWVASQSSLTVNGLTTVVGRKTTTVFENESTATLSGMLQLGAPYEPGSDLAARKQTLSLDGATEIRKCYDCITAGAEALRDFGVDLAIEQDIGTISTAGQTVTLAWMPSY